MKAVLLEPLAYREPDRIVAIQTLWMKTNRPGNVSGGDFPDLIAEPSPFAAASRYAGGELPVEVNGRASSRRPTGRMRGSRAFSSSSRWQGG